MNIKFKDVSSGIVEARAILEIAEGIFINEISILKKDRDIIVELPQKKFVGKDGKLHFFNILTFISEDKKVLFEMEIKEEYLNWRKKYKKVLIYKDISEE